MSWRPALDDPERFVAPGVGEDRLRMALVPVEQRLLEAGELEEPVLLGEPLHRPLVHRADTAFEQVALGVVRLARNAVPTLVQPLVHVAVVVDRLHEPLHAQVVTRLGRADEVVVRDVEGGPRGDVAPARPVDPLLRREPLFLRCTSVLQPVLVRAGEEPGVVADQPVPARQYVRVHGRVRRPEMGGVVDVVDRCRQEEALGHAPKLLAVAGQRSLVRKPLRHAELGGDLRCRLPATGTGGDPVLDCSLNFGLVRRRALGIRLRPRQRERAHRGQRPSRSARKPRRGSRARSPRTSSSAPGRPPPCDRRRSTSRGPATSGRAAAATRRSRSDAGPQRSRPDACRALTLVLAGSPRTSSVRSRARRPREH